MLEFARLNHSTVSFFNFSKPESAVSRWNRVSLNASKVCPFNLFFYDFLLFSLSIFFSSFFYNCWIVYVNLFREINDNVE